VHAPSRSSSRRSPPRAIRACVSAITTTAADEGKSADPADLSQFDVVD
jgi:hypothetical protein